MKQQMRVDALLSFIESQQIVLSPVQKAALNIYCEDLYKNAKIHSFISRSDVDYLLERHIGPAFYFSYMLRDERKNQLNYVDFGTGAGLPGFILAITYPGWNSVLIDSNTKKINFLKRTSAKTEVKPHLINDRIEKCLEEEQKFEIITARAFRSLNVLSKLAKRYLKPDGLLATIKGLGSYQNEIDSSLLKGIDVLPIEKAWQIQFPILKDKAYIRIYNS